jgi:hypothetical protein
VQVTGGSPLSSGSGLGGEGLGAGPTGPAAPRGLDAQPGALPALSPGGSSTAGLVPGTTPASALPGPGVTGRAGLALRSPIKLGFLATDFNKAAAAFGFSGEEADPFKAFKEMVRYLNSHGGFAGRTIQPDYFSLDGSSASGTAEYERACTHFTQDVKVEAVISDNNFHPTFEGCMDKADLLHLDMGIYGLDRTGQRQNRPYRAPTTFGVDRYSVALLETAVATGMVRRGDHVGVLVEACIENIRTFDQVVVPTARRLGLPLTTAQSACSEGTGSIPTETTQIQNAVLKFRNAGVTSVVTVSGREPFLDVLFAQGAEQQRYRPYYLMTSVATPARGVLSKGNGLSMPAGQLPQIRGLGWVPITDVGSTPSHEPSTLKQRRDLCRRMNPSQGGAASAPDAGVRLDFIGHVLRECDTMLFTGELIRATGGPLGLADVSRVYAQVLEGFPSVSNLRGSYRATPGRIDGEFAGAPFTYVSSCACIRYSGPMRTFS